MFISTIALFRSDLFMDELEAFCRLAKDIPHQIEDEINSLPLYVRQADNMQREMFEAMMVTNTADDEPDAPLIRIINTIDDEVSPPIEFHYSNHMWHGEGVPLPDFSKLPHCDCFGGKCDPNSTTCTCVQRQRKYLDEGMTGFIYDESGRLRVHDYPIFECNALCGCMEDCSNRVCVHLIFLGRTLTSDLYRSSRMAENTL